MIVWRASLVDAAVLTLTGLALYGARLLLRWAKAGDAGITAADFGGDD